MSVNKTLSNVKSRGKQLERGEGTNKLTMMGEFATQLYSPLQLLLRMLQSHRG